VTKGYRDAAARFERSRAYSISAFLHSLLAGQLESGRLEAEAAAIGLKTTGSGFRAVRVRPSARIPALRLRELIAEDCGQSSLVGIVGGDVVGVVEAPPRLPSGTTGGIGPAGRLHLLSVSFARASAALSAALVYHLEGLRSADDLALQAAVLDDDVGGALEHRVLAGLADLGDRGHVLADTAREFLACDASLTATAASLHVHVNTLRHRLARFQAATGIDLRRTEDLVAAWIALERLRVGTREEKRGHT
jgi:putative transposase